MPAGSRRAISISGQSRSPSRKEAAPDAELLPTSTLAILRKRFREVSACPQLGETRFC
jgi:hypothetical protein